MNSITLGDFPVDRRSCQLLGPTALIVQALMGLLAVLSLVYKRHRETQKRPWKIWLFDVSKQVLGQMFVHGLNVLISDVGSHHSAGNACTYYFLNVLLDTTLGVGLIYIILQSSTWLLSTKLGFKGLKTGQYGNPPSGSSWIRQTAVYVFSISTMKFLLVALYAVWPGISKIGDWLLSWTGDGESVQVIFVMGIFPMFMNVIQFWLIDSIVKASTNSTTVHSTSPRTSDSQDRRPLFNSPEDDDDDDDDNAPSQDIENGLHSSLRMTTEGGGFKMLVTAEDNKTNLLPPASTPVPLAGPPTSNVHNYPPDNFDGTPSSSLSSLGTYRARHKHKRSPSLLDHALVHSAPAVTTHDALTTRNSPRQALLPRPNSGKWEKNDWEEQVYTERSWSGQWSEQNRIHLSVR